MLACAVLACALSANLVSAHVLPEQPISVIGGRLVLAAEATATFAPDDPGFFNYTSYEFSALRNVRVRPLASRRFDIQAGRIPPTFEAMSGTAYGSGSMLIGQPLADQYLTSIRSELDLVVP